MLLQIFSTRYYCSIIIIFIIALAGHSLQVLPHHKPHLLLGKGRMHDGTQGKYSPYFLKDAPAIDSFVEAAGQTVSYYLKAWKILWNFNLTLTLLSLVARDPLLKPSCAIYLTFEIKSTSWNTTLSKTNRKVFTVPLAKFNCGFSFFLVLFVIEHKKTYVELSSIFIHHNHFLGSS